jgi:hypothetical protein
MVPSLRPLRGTAGPGDLFRIFSSYESSENYVPHRRVRYFYSVPAVTPPGKAITPEKVIHASSQSAEAVRGDRHCPLRLSFILKLQKTECSQEPNISVPDLLLGRPVGREGVIVMKRKFSIQI